MKLTRSLLKRLINEEIKTVSERKLPPKEDPEIVAQWEQIKPALDQLVVAFKDSSTGPHYTLADDTKTFKNKIDGGMRFVSYGETEHIDYHRGAGGEHVPVSSFSVTEGLLENEPIGPHAGAGLPPEKRNIFQKAFDRYERLKEELDQATRDMIDSLKPTGPSFKEIWTDEEEA
jgi:hypothetical protein